jgi:hypothetical protein
MWTEGCQGAMTHPHLGSETVNGRSSGEVPHTWGGSRPLAALKNGRCHQEHNFESARVMY